MQTSRFFDFDKWNQYLKDNFFCGELDVRQKKESSEMVYVTEHTEHSFQIAKYDFVENHFFTTGSYSKSRTIGIWEEFRLRTKIPTHFKGKNSIPPGKYRIRVQQENNSKPEVNTFIRGGIFGIRYWTKQKLPDSMPLDKILKGNLDSYAIS